MATGNESESGRGRVRVGTQGWSYDAWEGLVYPPGTPKTERLTHYARQFSLVEIDSTYYGTPRASTVAKWYDQTPDDFRFTCKVPSDITQKAKLAETSYGQLAQFLGTMRLLEPKLAVVCFQMSPGFRHPRDLAALEQALRRLPELGGVGLKFAIEFRHPSWLEKEVGALLREHNVAWAWADWEPTERYLEPMPNPLEDQAARRISADFLYVRLVGNHDAPIDYRTVSIDRTDELVRMADLALEFKRRRADGDVYILLNNHYTGCSAETVRQLERYFGVPVETMRPVTA
jgi:uncharacterized protein YecE (DUF72 family)